MEFFLPSVLLLLIAAAVVFFVLPRFGPVTLAIVSTVLLAFGIWKHYTTFGPEYRLSVWQLGLTAYAPYILVGGLFVAIAIYLFYLIPAATASNNLSTAPLASIPVVSTITNMPSASTATNSLTAGLNKAINTAATAATNAASAVTGATKNNSAVNTVLNALTGKKNNNKGLFA